MGAIHLARVFLDSVSGRESRGIRKAHPRECRFDSWGRVPCRIEISIRMSVGHQKWSITPAEKLRIWGAWFCCMTLKGDSFT